MTMIPFNRPPFVGTESGFISDAIARGHISGGGPYTRQCQDWFVAELGCASALLTPSCTHSLEMAALLLDIKPGDEVIMPSYTFVSTANAFALRGAHIVFVDIRPDTMNIDETLIEAAISSRTRAIVVVHYAGVACEMAAIVELARNAGIQLVEDAAQGFAARYHGRALGSFGSIAALSFHETKNLSSGGEGGLTVINSEQFCLRAEVIREKGTNRSQFLRGQVDKYTWTDIGSSYLMNDISAAYLWAQVQASGEIQARRMQLYTRYAETLEPLVQRESIAVPVVPPGIDHNAHMFFIKVRDLEERSRLIEHFARNDIIAPFHYVPLHRSGMGRKLGHFCGVDRYTSLESERLLRLPLFFNMTDDEQERVMSVLYTFFD